MLRTAVSGLQHFVWCSLLDFAEVLHVTIVELYHICEFCTLHIMTHLNWVTVVKWYANYVHILVSIGYTIWCVLFIFLLIYVLNKVLLIQQVLCSPNKSEITILSFIVELTC